MVVGAGVGAEVVVGAGVGAGVVIGAGVIVSGLVKVTTPSRRNFLVLVHAVLA